MKESIDMPQKKHLMIFGAHCGDGELQAGAIAAKYANAGHTVTFLSLTAGEKGNPPGVTVEEYRKQKIEESKKAAEIIGANTITLDYKDAELRFDDEIIDEVAKIVRTIRPDLVITHWVNSMHSDHALCPKILEAVQLKAGLPGFDIDGLDPKFFSIFHSENWEDMYEYTPDVFIDVSDVFEQYLEAISQYWFVMNSSSFDYYDYYKALGRVHGCRSRVEYAQTLKFPVGSNVHRVDAIPGLSL